MNKIKQTASLALLAILYSGCGTTIDSENRHTVHEVTKTSKTINAVNGTISLHANFSNNMHNFSITSKHATSNAHSQILLDTDQNTNTGYSVTTLDRKTVGVDYLLQDGVLYKFTGSSTTQWSWVYVKNYGNASLAKVPTILNNTQKMDVLGIFYDTNWRNTVRTAKYTYTPSQSTSNNDSGNNDNQALSPIERIQKQIGTYHTIDEFVYTPAKYGAAVLIYSSSNAPTIYLYGLDNSKNPQREYAIAAGDSDITFNDLKMLGNGKLQYTTIDKMSNVKTIIIYNYFQKREISHTVIGDESTSSAKDRFSKYLSNKHKYYSQGDDNKNHEIKRFTKLADSLYLVRYVYWNSANDYETVGVFNLRGNDISSMKNLAWIQYGPGGTQAENISIHPNRNEISYTFIDQYNRWKMSYNYRNDVITQKDLL